MSTPEALLAGYPPEVFITQQAFRQTLDAWARPGLIRTVPDFPRASLDNPALETLVMMLIDRVCTFVALAAGDDSRDAFATRITLLTHAEAVPAQEAGFALITADAPLDGQIQLIGELSGGTPFSPEKGATAIVECRCLAQIPQEGAPLAFSVEGPGVRTTNIFYVSDDAWFVGRSRRIDEFPCGIDLILVDTSGRAVALPRTARLSPWERGTT